MKNVQSLNSIIQVNVKNCLVIFKKLKKDPGRWLKVAVIGIALHKLERRLTKRLRLTIQRN